MKGKKKSLVFAVVIMVAAVAVSLIIYANKKNSTDKVIKRLDIYKQVIPVSNSSVLLFDNGLLIEGEGLNIKARGIDGTNLWSTSLKYNIKDILKCGEDVIVVTANNNIIVLDSSGKWLWQYELPLTPSTMLADKNNNFILQYNWQEHNTFEIFNSKGEKLCSGIIGKAQILSFDSFSDKFFTMTLLDISTDTVLSKVATYDRKGEILWAVNFDKDIAARSEYGAGGQIFVAGENFLKKYNSKGRMLNEIILKDKISNFAMSESLLVTIVKQVGFYEIVTYDKNLNQLGAIAIKNRPGGIFAFNDEYLIYNRDNLSLANKYGKITALYESNFDINRAYMHGDSSIYIISNRRLLKILR